jgi:uncharacterized delta-60 repeat protein
VVAAKRFLAMVLLASALVAALPGVAVAAPADLDRSFGKNGIVEVPAGAPLPSEAGARMAIGPKDEIFILYSNYPPCDPPFECAVGLTVARYTADGRLDPSFGAGSSPQLVVRQDAFDHEFDVAVGPDGKPVIAALDHAGGLVVARLDRAGRLDATFGAGGKAQRPPADFFDVATRGAAVAVQPDGKVLVASEGIREADGSRLLILRFLSNGQPDPGFGSGGQTAVVLSTQSLPAGILVGPDGDVSVPAPQCCVGGSFHFGEGFSVGRVLANGQPDPAWGGAGRLLFPTPGAQGTVEAVAMAPDGGILVSFEEEGSTVSTVGNLVKIRPDGGLARRFGNQGRLRLFSRVGSVVPNDLAVDAQGRIVGVGWFGRITAFRLRANGSADRTFNGGQSLLLPFGGSHSGSTPYLVDTQSSGRIVVLGESGSHGSKTFGLIGLRGGTDRTRCQERKATIVGTRRKDELTGTPRRDVIAALAGNDTVRGMGGADLICGGIGKDRLLGGAGRDSVQRQPGGELTR